MRCDICRKDWSYNRLCPTCWSDLVNKHMPSQDWKCGVCGEDVIVKGMELEEGTLIQQIVCPKCLVVYLPEGG